MKRILGDGPMPCSLFILGERPGVEEHHQGRGFVGPAGEELWARIWKVLRLTRDAFYVSNLVKTFSMEPPTAAEITRDAKLLRTELVSVRPRIIITIGYHAARALLPQFQGVVGDYFHGTCFLIYSCHAGCSQFSARDLAARAQDPRMLDLDRRAAQEKRLRRRALQRETLAGPSADLQLVEAVDRRQAAASSMRESALRATVTSAKPNRSTASPSPCREQDTLWMWTPDHSREYLLAQEQASSALEALQAVRHRLRGAGATCVSCEKKIRATLVVPVCHSSAALRQPDRYQNQLTSDLRAVKEVLDGARQIHRTRRPAPYRVGLAGFGKEGLTLGLDTEGSTASPECVTLAQSEKAVACIETTDGKRPQFLKPSVEGAQRLAIHHSKHDVAVLRTLGIDHLPRVDDTMLQAYLLGLPQGLKVLAYRECGFEMSDYSDLVDPLDEALVRRTLQEQVNIWMHLHGGAAQCAETKAERRAKLLHTKKTKKMVASILKRELARMGPVLPPLRVVKGVARMLAKGVDDETVATDD